MSLVSEARAKLQKIKLTKSILDDNLHVLQRQNKDAFGVGIHLYNPHVNPKLLGEESMKEIRAKKIVSETISTLSQQVKDEVESDLLAERKRPKSLRAPVVGRRPSRLIPKKSSSNIPVKKSGSDHKRTFLFPGKPPPPARKPAPRRVESENDLDRIYGLGPHSNQRRTVFDPYLHITSPQKDAKYRSKRALETVNINRVRSEKSQTEIPVAYALAPPTVNYGRPLQSSAIAIGPPQIMDNDAEPVLIEAHKFSCHLSTETESLRTPPVSPIKKQPPSPPPVAPKVSAKPVNNELPGTSLNNNQDDLESSTASLPLRVQLTGSQQRPPVVVCCPDALCMLCKGIAPATCTCKNPRPPPRPATPCCCEQTVRARRKQPKRDPCEQEATQWVEEEVMARVLSEMYPCQSKWKLPCKGQQQQEAGYTEERGLPFVMDAGLDLPESSLKKLVDDELRDIIRQMIGDRFVPKAPSPPPSPKRTTCPMTPAPTKKDGPLVLSETPLNTPSSSPREAPQKQITIRRAKTPSVTSNEDSTEEIKVSTILDEIPPISQVDSLTCNVKSLDEDLPTPDRTPRSSPKPPTPPGTPPPPPVEKKKTPPPKVETKFVDPWEGADFPLDADANPFTRPKPDRKITYYPMDNDPCDVIVRPVTPPPRDAVVQVDSPESSSDELTETQTDQTISEGQLVISHGEIKPKKIPYLDKLMPYDNDNSLQETLRDLDGAGMGLHDEVYSDGEVNTKRVARRIPGLPAHVPSVYARPRQPLPTGPSADDLDEISVGEVVADDSKKREKFNKWKNSRKKRAAAAETASSTEDEVSVGEYHPPQDENTTAGDDVIMVTPYEDDKDDDGEATDLLGTLPQNNRTLSGPFGQSLQTTGSVIPPDSLDDTGKRLVGFGTDEQQRNLPPFRIPPQHEDDADDDSIEEIFS